MTVIQPTHTCFDDALDFISWRLKRTGDPALVERLTLVHGICTIPEGEEAGKLFAHAWVEESQPDSRHVLAWQSGFYNGELITYAVTVPELYGELKVASMRRYTIREAWEENRKHCTYGPWGPELKALCVGGEK